MRRLLAIFLTLHPIPLNFLIYEENFIFFFISVAAHIPCAHFIYIYTVPFLPKYQAIQSAVSTSTFLLQMSVTTFLPL
jgi:hypothetical protein